MYFDTHKRLQKSDRTEAKAGLSTSSYSVSWLDHAFLDTDFTKILLFQKKIKDEI